MNAAQRQILGQALADAVQWRTPAIACSDCDAAPTGFCPDHTCDVVMVDEYLQLAGELGIEVPL